MHCNILLYNISLRTPYIMCIVCKVSDRTRVIPDAVINNFRDELSVIGISLLLNVNLATDMNTDYETLKQNITKTYDKHFPDIFVKFNEYRHKGANWITSGILKSIEFRDKLYKRLKICSPAMVDTSYCYTKPPLLYLYASIPYPSSHSISVVQCGGRRSSISNKLNLHLLPLHCHPFAICHPVNMTLTSQLCMISLFVVYPCQRSDMTIVDVSQHAYDSMYIRSIILICILRNSCK